MRERKRPLPHSGVVGLNDHIAHLYRSSWEKSPLEGVIDTIKEMIPGELHLSFLTKEEGDVSFATSNGQEGTRFIMATMAAAESHPLIYQTDREVNAISGVLTLREWRRREMYRLARPFVKMQDALGTDIRVSPGVTFSTCVIRDRRNFREAEHLGLRLMMPHFINILRMNPDVDSDRFHIFPLSSLPVSRRALDRLMRERLNLCGSVSGRLADWIGFRRIMEEAGSDFTSFRSLLSSCSALFIPPTGRAEGAVAVRPGAKAMDPISVHPTLTRRENEIGHWLCSGKTNAEIATILGIMPGTVKRHVENIFEKLGVPNRVAAVRLIHDSAKKPET